MKMVLKLLRQILDEQKRTNRILGELARPKLGTMQLTQSWRGIRNKCTEALWDGKGDE